jgi:hypothetical protein
MAVEIKTLYKKKIEKEYCFLDKIIIVLGYLLETIFNSILPFAYGVYFVFTNNVSFIFIFFLHLIFYLRIFYEDEEIRISFIRRI